MHRICYIVLIASIIQGKLEWLSFSPYLVNCLQSLLCYYIFGSSFLILVEDLLKIIHTDLQILSHDPKGLSYWPSAGLQKLLQYVPLGHPSSRPNAFIEKGLKWNLFKVTFIAGWVNCCCTDVIAGAGFLPLSWLTWRHSRMASSESKLPGLPLRLLKCTKSYALVYYQKICFL